MGNMFADFIGFVAAMLGGFAFKEELANAGSFTYTRLGQVWDKVRLWYLHSVAAVAWGVITVVIVFLVGFNMEVYRLASNAAMGTSNLWFYTQIGAAVVLLLLLVACWVWLLPAKRIKNWAWINKQTDELEKLSKARAERELQNAPAAELARLQADIDALMNASDEEYIKRYGHPRSPMLAVLAVILAPMIMGIVFCYVAVVLCTMNGVEWYDTVRIAGIGFVSYLIGEILLRLFSGVLGSVLGDGGDAFNRLANAMLIRPGLLILPFITEENYEKIMPKPIEAPFKKAADAVKGATLSFRSICLTMIIWAGLLPQVAVFGVVLIAGICSYIIVVVHKERGLDPKNFVEGSSRVHLWFMMSVTFFRIVECVIYALWRQWWSGDVIWNPMARWSNNLLDDGGFNWTTVGLVIFGGIATTVFANKMKDMKHPFMLNAFRVLTAFFGFVAILPLVGLALDMGGIELRLPMMPSNREVAVVEAEAAPTPPPPRVADSIDRMRAGTAVTPTPAVAPVAPPAVPPVARPTERASAPAAPVDMCDRIARAPGLTDAFREHMLGRHHCDG